MALLADYTAGTVSVSGTTVTGTGTAWQTARFQEGDIFIAAGYWAVVASVGSEASITLVDWAGPSLTNAPYRLRYMSDGSRASAQARQLIDMLGGTGTLEALAAVVGAPNTMPYFTGPGAAAATPLTPFARALLASANDTAALSVLGATSPVVTDARMPAFLLPSGYILLPNGFILQWGIQNPSPNLSNYTVTFPVAFPNACRAVVATAWVGPPSASEFVMVNSLTSTGFDVNSRRYDDANGTGWCYWLAVGH